MYSGKLTILKYLNKLLLASHCRWPFHEIYKRTKKTSICGISISFTANNAEPNIEKTYYTSLYESLTNKLGAAQ